LGGDATSPSACLSTPAPIGISRPASSRIPFAYTRRLHAIARLDLSVTIRSVPHRCCCSRCARREWLGNRQQADAPSNRDGTDADAVLGKFAAGRRRPAISRIATQRATKWRFGHARLESSTMRGEPASAKKYSATKHQAQANGQNQTFFLPAIGRKVGTRYEHTSASTDHEQRQRSHCGLQFLCARGSRADTCRGRFCQPMTAIALPMQHRSRPFAFVTRRP